MSETFLTVLVYAAVVLSGWLVLSTLLALLIGKSVAIADEREIGPQSNTEAERWAA